jgi:hypothetical protein
MIFMCRNGMVDIGRGSTRIRPDGVKHFGLMLTGACQRVGQSRPESRTRWGQAATLGCREAVSRAKGCWWQRRTEGTERQEDSKADWALLERCWLSRECRRLRANRGERSRRRQEGESLSRR